MKKIIFLCSGNGGNLKFLKQCIDQKIVGNLELPVVIADRQCGAIEFAKKSNIRIFQIDYTKGKKDNAGLKTILEQFKPDLIVTTIHKIIDKEIIDAYKCKIINLHYSLLPAFKGYIGAKTVKQALNYGCKIIGTTVHYVNENVDSGEIISQSAIIVGKNEDFKNVMDRVFRSGCLNLLNSVIITSNKEIKILAQSDNVFVKDQYLFSPAILFDINIFNNNFWNMLK